MPVGCPDREAQEKVARKSAPYDKLPPCLKISVAVCQMPPAA